MKTSLVISHGGAVRRSGKEFLWRRIANESLGEFATARRGLGGHVRPFGGGRVRISTRPSEKNNAVLAVTAVLAKGRVLHSQMEERVGS